VIPGVLPAPRREMWKAGQRPQSVGIKFWSAEGAKLHQPLQKTIDAEAAYTISRSSALRRFQCFLPGACPEAFTVRAVALRTAVLQTTLSCAWRAEVQILCGPAKSVPGEILM